MIIRTEGGRLRIITQVDHAVIAAQFADAWGAAPFRAPEPLAPVHLATAIHDEGWRDWEDEPRLRPDTGRPYDFVAVPPDDRFAIYERSVAAAMAAHPYAGLLVSMHGSGFYQQRYGHMPKLEYKEVAAEYQTAMAEFLERQRQVQEQLLADLRPQSDALWTHYRWLQCWDAIAVYISQSDPAEHQRFCLGVMPHYPGGPEAELFLAGVGEGTFTVSPWPFAKRRLDLLLPVRYLPDRPYASQEDFLDTFTAAPTQPLAISVIPDPGRP